MKRELSQELQTLRQRVEAWRARQGGRGSRIPEGLWNEAVRVVGIDGLWATSRATRLNYERLRGRVAEANSSRAVDDKGNAGLRADRGKTRLIGRASGGGPRAQLVAVGMSPFAGGGKMVIELESRRGDRMRIEAPGTSAALVAVCDRFWSTAP